MTDVFGSIYATAYDDLYKDKNYAAECDLIERVFATYGDDSIRTILDLGCGTASHTVELAKRGYGVVGVDRSEEMLACARQKAVEVGVANKTSFYAGDIRHLDVRRTFDACLMMFAVLSYQLEADDITATLKTVRRHLRAGGLLIFDAWYGPAVTSQRPSERSKIVETAAGKIVRVASGELDSLNSVCKVNYRMSHFCKDQLIAETEECHLMRYFFPAELLSFLESAGFSLLRIGGFPEFDSDPSETTWSALWVAQAV